MGVYKEPTADELLVIKEYTKFFENVKVSEAVKLGGKLYKEVVFKKKTLGKDAEYLYLDEDNKIVENENILLRLGRLTFFMDAFLSDDKGSIIKALQGDEEIEKNKNDLELINAGFNILIGKENKYDVSQRDIEKVQVTLNKLLELRGKTNEKLKIFLQAVDNEMIKKEYFDEDVVEGCLPMYKEVMACNYEKVQLIAKGANSYNGIKRAAEKARKSYSIRFVTAHTEPLMKVSYMMGYFENLIRTYNKLVEMSYNEYIKGIVNAGKINAQIKYSFIRKK